MEQNRCRVKRINQRQVLKKISSQENISGRLILIQNLIYRFLVFFLKSDLRAKLEMAIESVLKAARLTPTTLNTPERNTTNDDDDNEEVRIK